MGYKYWLDVNESAVYCGHNHEDAGNFLNLVVIKIMEEKRCTMLDLVNFDCDIHYVIVKPAGYGAVHGWTEAQVQQMYIMSRSDGYWVWLGPPVSLNDETEEKSERVYFLSDTTDFIYTNAARADAKKLLDRIVDYIRNYGVCSIYDLMAFNVDLDDARDEFSWRYCNNWGWTEDQLPGMDVKELPKGMYTIQLGKPVDLTIYEEEEEPEMKFVERAIDIDRCTGCQHLCVPTFYEPCKSCMDGCNFTPRNDSKGEKAMNNYEENLMEIDRNSIIPKRIWFNEHDGKFYTTVEWEDGTKTTVGEENKEHASQYGGFTAALAKRMFGTGNSIYLMNKAIDKTNEKKKLREQQREQERIQKQKKREADAAQRKFLHEMRVRGEIERLQVEQEAQKRLRDERFQSFARALLGLNSQKKTNSNDKTAKEESAE